MNKFKSLYATVVFIYWPQVEVKQVPLTKNVSITTKKYRKLVTIWHQIYDSFKFYLYGNYTLFNIVLHFVPIQLICLQRSKIGQEYIRYNL